MLPGIIPGNNTQNWGGWGGEWEAPRMRLLHFKVNCPLLKQQKQSLGKKLKIDLQRTISHGIDRVSRLYSQRYINTWKIVQTTYKTRALVHLSWHCFCTLSQNLWPESRIDFPWQPAFQPKNKTRQKGMLLIFKENKQRSEYCQLQHVWAKLRRHNE